MRHLSCVYREECLRVLFSHWLDQQEFCSPFFEASHTSSATISPFLSRPMRTSLSSSFSSLIAPSRSFTESMSAFESYFKTRSIVHFVSCSQLSSSTYCYILRLLLEGLYRFFRILLLFWSYNPLLRIFRFGYRIVFGLDYVLYQV